MNRAYAIKLDNTSFVQPMDTSIFPLRKLCKNCCTVGGNNDTKIVSLGHLTQKRDKANLKIRMNMNIRFVQEKKAVTWRIGGLETKYRSLQRKSNGLSLTATQSDGIERLPRRATRKSKPSAFCVLYLNFGK